MFYRSVWGFITLSNLLLVLAMLAELFEVLAKLVVGGLGYLLACFGTLTSGL